MSHCQNCNDLIGPDATLCANCDPAKFPEELVRKTASPPQRDYCPECGTRVATDQFRTRAKRELALAKEMKETLILRFPGVKFSVTTSSIRWTDGPSSEEVLSVTGQDWGAKLRRRELAYVADGFVIVDRRERRRRGPVGCDGCGLDIPKRQIYIWWKGFCYYNWFSISLCNECETVSNEFQGVYESWGDEGISSLLMDDLMESIEAEDRDLTHALLDLIHPRWMSSYRAQQAEDEELAREEGHYAW